jgi:CHAT domain-containing protein/tetratricopeptide (TPR) repeat protein
VLELLNKSDVELQRWLDSQDTSSLRSTFEQIDKEIRANRLTAGQPRSESSANAVDLAKLALKIAELNRDEALQVEAWRMLAYTLNADEQYQQSLAYYSRAIAGLETLGELRLATRTRLGFISALLRSGKYKDALQVARAAEQWLLENRDDDGLARLYNNVGGIYFRLDERVQAYQYYAMAAESFEKVGDEQSLAQTSLNLGIALSNIDQFEESDAMFERSEKLSLRFGMTDLWAQAGYNRAYLHYLRGRYGEALQAFNRLRSRFQESGSWRHYALCDLDEAEIYLQLNLSKEAATLARRALRQFQKIGDSYEQAKAAAFLGVGLTQLQRYSEALEVFREAQQQFEHEGNAYWVAVLDLYRSEAQFALKRFWEARSLADSARGRFTALGIVSKQILSLVMLGRVDLELKDLPAAQSAVDEIAMLSHTNVPLLLFPYYLLCGDIANRKSDWKKAAVYYQSATEDLELHHSRINHDDLRVTFFNGRNRPYEELTLLKLQPSAADHASVVDAYTWCERAKSRGLIELLTHHLPTVQTHSDSVLSRINRLREQLNVLYVRSQPEIRAISTVASFDTIADKETELARSLREISHSDPEYVSLQQNSTVSLPAVQQFLPADTTLIQYFVARDEVLAFVVTANDAFVERHLCPLYRIGDIRQRLGFQLEKFVLGSAYVASHSDQVLTATQRHLHELYNNLFARLAPRINTKRLIVVPHGVLHLLPFHAFFDGSRYVIDDFEVSYAPSASVLKYCLDKDDLQGAAPSLVGVADPQAPFVQSEVQAIQSLFADSRVLLNEAATKQAFGDLAAQSAFLHIATHAVFRQDNPMFSAFKLYDGWVTASDLFAMPCQTNLVTLSGCQSGVSQVSGSDDLLGLMRGFLYAGARSLLVSLWNVDDEATARLMFLFYTYWKEGRSRSTALQLAMKTLRESHSNPFYWAPFMLTGKP